MDVNKVLLDVEHESEIPDDEPSDAKFRYSVINAAVGYIAKCVHKAAALKPYMGRHCYVASAIGVFFTTAIEELSLVLEQHDGSRIALDREHTMFLIIMNGRFLGGRVQGSPIACLNDGLLDVTMHHGPAGTRELLAFFKTAVAQKGAHIYRDNYAYLRGRSLRITNMNR